MGYIDPSFAGVKPLQPAGGDTVIDDGVPAIDPADVLATEVIEVHHRIYVRPEALSNFDALRPRSPLSGDVPGLLHWRTLMPQAEGLPYVVISLWTSYHAYLQWRGSWCDAAHAGIHHATSPDMLLRPSVTEIFRVTAAAARSTALEATDHAR
jgi:heme-degrading monooxygenase HmoA